MKLEMFSLSQKGFGVSSGLILALAVFWIYKDMLLLDQRLKPVLNGLLRAEKKLVSSSRPKVAVGFGGCLDVFLPAVNTFEMLKIQPSDERIHHDTVASEAELEQLFNYFFTHGAAAERYISSKKLFTNLVDAAHQVPEAVWALGGNAPVMAKRMANEGCEILLGSRSTPNVQFGHHVTAIGAQQYDDIHIIYEYDKGAVWGNLTSPRANRLIVHNDQYNPMLNMLEEFQLAMLDFKPQLLVVGGLQMMDNFPFKEGVREARLTVLEQMLALRSPAVLFHFEMASFTESALLDELVAKVMPYVSSLGMNEQELPNIVAAMEGGDVQLVADSNPRVATTLDNMRLLLSLVRRKQTESSSRHLLTRIHVHTLAYQVIFTEVDSSWKNTMAATAKASLVANRHVCGNMNINVENAKLLLDESFSASVKPGSQRVQIVDDRPVSCWSEETADGLHFDACLAPNLVCTSIIQTAGGGDNISAAALAAQIYV